MGRVQAFGYFVGGVALTAAIGLSGGARGALAGTPRAGAAIQPIQFGMRVTIPKASQNITKVVYTVPAGRRLVLDTVSVRFSEQITGEYVQAGFSVGAGFPFFIPLSHLETRGQSYDFNWVGIASTQVQARAGQLIMVRVSTGSVFLTNKSSVDESFSGYLTSS